MSTSRDGYAPGWGSDAVTMMASRVATERAAFTLPFLRDGMHVLDVGCGPGSLSVGLAEAVARHGQLLGYDAESSQVRTAQATCLASGIVNARFEVASAYELPAKDETIDVYFSHAMFEHLSRPARALAEAYRSYDPVARLRSRPLTGVRPASSRRPRTWRWRRGATTRCADAQEATRSPAAALPPGLGTPASRTSPRPRP